MFVGKYSILPCTVKYLRQQKGKFRIDKKTGERKPVLVPMWHRHIWFETVTDKDGRPIENGMVWRFTSTKLGPDRQPRWSDSRDRSQDSSAPKVCSLSNDALFKELVRLTTEYQAGRIMAEVTGVELTRDEYAALIGATVIPCPSISDDGEEYERTIMEGGLLTRIQLQTAHTRANVEWSKRVNKR